MNAIELEPRKAAETPWSRPRTLAVQGKTSGVSTFGYPSPRQYHAPTDADRMSEEAERWDGLS